MATGESFLRYVLDNIPDRWAVRSRKMFGEYMIYLNDKPVLLICDNTVFAKKLPELEDDWLRVALVVRRACPMRGLRSTGYWTRRTGNGSRRRWTFWSKSRPCPKNGKNRRDKYACMAQRRNFL